MAKTSLIRRTITNLTEEPQMRELNRQLDWIWHILLTQNASGTFTDADGKVITVKDGMISSIEEPGEEEP